MNALSERPRSPLKVVWGVPVPFAAYDGFERVYGLCGVSFGSYRVITCIEELTNDSPYPEDNFVVYQDEITWLERGLRSPESVLGYAHTHPIGQSMPSQNDLRGIPKGKLGVVVDGDVWTWYMHTGLVHVVSLGL